MPEHRRRRTFRREVRRALVAGAVLALLVGMFSVDYTVERGDTLNKIAREHGVSVADLLEANDISNPNLIRIGQVLVIPGEEGEPEIVHVVARGDTLGKIAKQYGSSVSTLIEANRIANANLIRIGQSIVVPGSGVSTSATSTGSSESGGDTPAPSPEPAVRSGSYHVVKSGDTLANIAALYSGVSAEQIARANGIVNNTIYVGSRLFLDGSNYVAEGGAGGSEGTYIVRSGDRLGDIAAAHGTNISNLAAMNNISNINLIRAGQALTVPGSSAWVCPIDGGRFFNDWGFPRSAGVRFHEGNDIFADYGTPVQAPVAGAVRRKVGSLGGNQVNLYGSDGIVYIASHLSEFGESGNVGAGDIIGYVGTSGNAVGTSPHLHFGMYDDEGPVNPYPSLIANGCK